MYLLVTAVKRIAIILLTFRLQRKIRMQARVAQTARRNEDPD
jgi:hypothetical protein